MKHFFYIPFLLISFFSFTSISYSQERTVTGTVTTLEKIAVVNAEIMVLSSKITVLTDSVGNFRVSCLLKDKIKISAKGFYFQKVKINDKTNEAFINLKFKPGKKNIDVAAKFGHIKDKDKSFAISKIKNNRKFDYTKYSNMLEVVVNSSPSIVLNGGGIIIRGSNSLNGSNAALIILDGIDMNSSQLASLPPSDVKSVDILKGSYAATYGIRGANGVVIITTKRGGDIID